MQRYNWIDVMKGIGIIVVVIGHIFGGYLKDFIFLFHMPLFFFISGYLYKNKINQKQYFKDKFISLGIPYISFLFLIYPASNWDNYSKINSIEFLIFIIKPIIGGRFLINYTGVFWFITCFFVLQILMNYFIIKFNQVTLFFVITFLLLLSYLNSMIFPNFWLPGNINVALAAAPFFYVGYLIKINKVKFNKLIILILSIIVIVSLFHLSNTYDMKMAIYGVPIITFLSSLILIFQIKILSKMIIKLGYISVPFIDLGKASMIIMYLHLPLQFFCFYFISENQILRFCFALFGSYLFYRVFTKYRFTRAVLLGDRMEINSYIKLIKR